MNRMLGIVIPNWNGAKHLPAMLDSILSQSYDDWVTYIVDDYSTDESWDIISSYSQRDTRIKSVKRNRLPKGAQTCRNIGIELTKDCEYVCFFDSDDLLAPWCFEQRVHFMEKNKDVDCGVFPAKSFSGSDILKSGDFIFGFDIFEEPILLSMLQDPLPMVGWTNIYRKSSIDKYNLSWDEKILSKQDSDYNMMALIKGINISYAKDASVDYFWRVDNTVSTITKKIVSPEHTDSHVYRLEKLMKTLPMDFKKNNDLVITNYLMTHCYMFKTAKNKDGIRKILNNPWICSYLWKKVLFSIIYLTPSSRKLLSTSKKEHILFSAIIKIRTARWESYFDFKENKKQHNFGLTSSMIQHLPIPLIIILAVFGGGGGKLYNLNCRTISKCA